MTNMRNIVLSLLAAVGLGTSSCTADNVPVLEPQEFIANAKADSKAVILDVPRHESLWQRHEETEKKQDLLRLLP